MKKVRLRAAPAPAIPDWKLRMTDLELLCRQKVGELIQAVLIAEVDEFLGRVANVPGKSASGYRDGYEEARTVAYGSTPVTIRRPRVRESEIPFTSEILPPFKRRFPELDKAMHELWLQGLSTRDFEPSLRALLGETTPLSPSTVSRVNKRFIDDYQAWLQCTIADEYVYLWADGVYLDAGAEEERRVMLVVIGVDTKGDKALLAIEDAFGESYESWMAVFENLKARGLHDVAMLVADGAQGIWKAFSAVYPRAKQQRCWLHKMRNVLDKLPEKHRATIHDRLSEAMNAVSRAEAERLIEKLAQELSRQYPKATACLRQDIARFSRVPLAPSTDDQRHRIKLRCRPFTDQRLQAYSSGRISDVSGLGAADASRPTLAPLQRLLPSRERARGAHQETHCNVESGVI
jgi:transposase-like protein